MVSVRTDPALLERAATALAAAAARWQELADEAARRWTPGAFVGLAARAYAASVAAAGTRAQERAERCRRTAVEWWVLAGLLRRGGPLDPGAVDVVTRRDLAARAAVEADVVGGRTRRRDGLLGDDEQERWRAAQAVRRAVAGREAVVWAYDPDAHDGDGTAVIGVGVGLGEKWARDADGRAPVDHVVLVPGVGTEVVDAPRYVARAEAVVAAAGEHGSEATVGWFWLGYDAPDGPTDPAMLTPRRAVEGGEALSADLTRMQSATATPGVADRWTAVGHSYGATTVAEAAAGPGLEADAVALVGSPGAGSARTAVDLGVDRVFVARDSRDAVAALGDEGWLGRPALGLGRDPAEDDFGAVRMRAERPGRHAWWGIGDGHAGYFTPDSESLRNLGAVVAGAYDRVEVAEPTHDPWWGRPRDPEWRRPPG